MTKSLETIKNELAIEHPVILEGSDNTGYVELTAKERENKINEWANNLYQELINQEAKAAKEAARAAILVKLGLTDEEAAVLLG